MSFFDTRTEKSFAICFDSYFCLFRNIKGSIFIIIFIRYIVWMILQSIVRFFSIYFSLQSLHKNQTQPNHQMTIRTEKITLGDSEEVITQQLAGTAHIHFIPGFEYELFLLMFG